MPPARLAPLVALILAAASSLMTVHAFQARQASPPGAAARGRQGPSGDVPNAVEVPAPHLTLRLGSDLTAVAPGGKVTLVAEITPAVNVHVYGPGQDTYLPIVLEIKSPSPLVAIGPLVSPTPTIYVFEPTNEHFKVYSARTRLTRVVTIADAPGLHTDVARARPFRLAGTLRYQACDDRVCFQPNSVAVSWTIGVK